MDGLVGRITGNSGISTGDRGQGGMCVLHSGMLLPS
jgi:hypothetical protein